MKKIEQLKDLIYESLMSNEDFGLGEMGSCRDEAERIVEEWIGHEVITKTMVYNGYTILIMQDKVLVADLVFKNLSEAVRQINYWSK